MHVLRTKAFLWFSVFSSVFQPLSTARRQVPPSQAARLQPARNPTIVQPQALRHLSASSFASAFFLDTHVSLHFSFAIFMLARGSGAFVSHLPLWQSANQRHSQLLARLE
jgi:hypothetical protein